METRTPQKPLGERAEDFAAGRTGAACPFCGDHATRVIREEDRTGILAARWACDNCDEDGPCLPDGTLIWMPEATDAC